MDGDARNTLSSTYPVADSPLNLKGFFDTLYARYDERFVFGAPKLAKITARLEWDPASPGLRIDGLDYAPRIGL